ncbi:tRNA (guanine(9)-N(1))-methyltransferase, partial [Ascosphaera acerosa]
AGEIIYLSSDSDETLTELKPYCTYVVGGLVDKNRHKGVCYRSAVANGVKTAKLPIGEYMKMSSRQVLTTNHVVEIMLRWLELGDWGQAFDLVIPKRKGGVLISKDEQPNQEDGVEEAEEEAREAEEAEIENDDEREGDERLEDASTTQQEPQKQSAPSVAATFDQDHATVTASR